MAAMKPMSLLTIMYACFASNSADDGEKCELVLPRYLAGSSYSVEMASSLNSIVK